LQKTICINSFIHEIKGTKFAYGRQVMLAT
jgi:hypothetical protein